MSPRWFIKLEFDDLWCGHWNDSMSINVESIAKTQFYDWIDKNIYHTVQLWKRLESGECFLCQEHVSEDALLIGAAVEYNRRLNLILDG